jgi:hypothetical protein
MSQTCCTRETHGNVVVTESASRLPPQVGPTRASIESPHDRTNERRQVRPKHDAPHKLDFQYSCFAIEPAG